MGIQANDRQRGQFIDYLRLLERWNRAFNLTAIREPAQMVGLHLLDSLSLQPYLEGSRIIDIGSGAGLPGIPLAILNPELEFHLLDSNGKKTRFLFQARQSLGLDNVREIKSRAEDYRPTQPYDLVVSRAFGSLADLVVAGRHLLSPQGFFLAMKGKFPQSELSAIPKGFIVAFSQPLHIPDVAGERHLVRIDQQAPANA